MIIIELVEGEETLEDIERICRHFLEREDIQTLVTDDQLKEIKAILEPTLREDGNESKKRALWKDLLDNLVMTDHHGAKLHFFRDKKHNRLYFGNQEGYETITELSENEDSITSSNERL
ncbi:hypothetical protein [Psychrobacter lutiphocae]|uniref:hypothetical protein n=1 Tax=Psychrobacter lutiphocae TaxID=540500 RepID=UPI00036CA551|nr:hypothetical protein [Psychrobacter lutiphocae]